jgi:hypothetical protein
MAAWAEDPERPARLASWPFRETNHGLPLLTIMTYPQATAFGAPNPNYDVNSVLFCSCAPMRTKLEQTSKKREIAVMWIKDAAAGAGLIIFMISSFALASGAHAVLAIL